VLINRAAPELDLGLPLFSAYKVEAKSYPADDLPEWLAKIPAVKPGTRKSA
jgi:orotate phosphoribosyltransferase